MLVNHSVRHLQVIKSVSYSKYSWFLLMYPWQSLDFGHSARHSIFRRLLHRGWKCHCSFILKKPLGPRRSYTLFMLHYDKMKSPSKNILLHASPGRRSSTPIQHAIWPREIHTVTAKPRPFSIFAFLFNRGHFPWHAFNADRQKWNSGLFRVLLLSSATGPRVLARARVRARRGSEARPKVCKTLHRPPSPAVEPQPA